MKRSVLRVGIALLLVGLFCTAAFAADQKTINGQINDQKQLVAEDGKVYSIAASETGDKLAAMAGKKVSVTGTVAEKDGKMVVEVAEFKEAK